MTKHKVMGYLNLFKTAWQIFVENHPIQFASAFAYFSLYGLPSILLINIFILSFIFDLSDLFEVLRKQVSEVIGADGANILTVVTQNYMEEASKGIFILIVYIITIFLLATQLIVFFQDILNDLWQIKPSFKNFWQKQVLERGLTFIMVLITGLLFFVSVAVEKAVLFISSILGSSELTGTTEFIINVITAIFVYLWFAILYKVLPFVKIKWEPTLMGAAVTFILFFIGFWLLLEFVVKEDSLEDLYDFTAPIVLVAFWVFYNSLAFLYGASFTKAYAELRGKKIEPKSFAYRFKVVKEEN